MCRARLCLWLRSHHCVLPHLRSAKCVDTISGSRPFGVRQDVPAESSQGAPGGSLGSSGVDRKPQMPSPEHAARTSPPPPVGSFPTWPVTTSPQAVCCRAVLDTVPAPDCPALPPAVCSHADRSTALCLSRPIQSGSKHSASFTGSS